MINENYLYPCLLIKDIKIPWNKGTTIDEKIKELFTIQLEQYNKVIRPQECNSCDNICFPCSGINKWEFNEKRKS
jgi:hypothetical protein